MGCMHLNHRVLVIQVSVGQFKRKLKDLMHGVSRTTRILLSTCLLPRCIFSTLFQSSITTIAMARHMKHVALTPANAPASGGHGSGLETTMNGTQTSILAHAHQQQRSLNDRFSLMSSLQGLVRRIGFTVKSYECARAVLSHMCEECIVN